MDRNFLKFIAVIFLLVSASFCIALIVKSKKAQELKSDLAHLNHVEYGLFNMFEWKRKVSDALSDKILSFELNPDNREELKAQVSGALNKLFDEVEETIQEGKSNSLMGAIKGVFVETFVDKDKLRAKIPEYSEQILLEFDKEENRKAFSEMINAKLTELLEENIGEEDKTLINNILAKHNHTHVEAASFYIADEIRKAKNELSAYAGIIFIAFVLSFIASYQQLKEGIKFHYYIVILGILVLLVAGVITPMIDIDARISSIKLDFLGRDISFENQILFFQSKSILDVVIILLKNFNFQSILVGALVLLFSIIFPLAKLISTSLIIHNPSKNKNKVLHFLSFYSGKWSMADVMVVAIFMAYIGFSSIIENQLKSFEAHAGHSEILTTNHTSLQPGFFLFICFTLSSLFISHILFKKLKSRESNPKLEIQE